MNAVLLILLELTNASLVFQFAHGTFGSAHARQIAHRYRPLVFPTTNAEDHLVIIDPEALNRYIRAIIDIESKVSFAVVSSDIDNDIISMFIIHRADEYHVLKSILWGTNVIASKKNQAERLESWHRERFNVRLILDLRVEDPSIWHRSD
mgnify:CR=1 FL=1